jgi:hypothetical protein
MGLWPQIRIGCEHRLQEADDAIRVGLSNFVQFDSSRNEGGRCDRRTSTGPRLAKAQCQLPDQSQLPVKRCLAVLARTQNAER